MPNLCPIILGFVLMMFAWVAAMIFRMENDDATPSWRRMVGWCGAGGALFAILLRVFPSDGESDCPVFASSIFGVVSFFLAVEYRRAAHCRPGVRDIAVGIACAMAMAFPVANSSYAAPLLEPGWLTKAFAAVAIVFFLFMDFMDFTG